MKKLIVLALIGLSACTSGEGAPQYFWDVKMCTQPKYKHLDRCKEVEQDNSVAMTDAAVLGATSQM